MKIKISVRFVRAIVELVKYTIVLFLTLLFILYKMM
jgi:hypothetical protein